MTRMSLPISSTGVLTGDYFCDPIRAKIPHTVDELRGEKRP